MFPASGLAWLRLLLCWVAAAVMTFLVFVATSWNLDRPTSDGWIGALVPEDPSITLVRAMEEFLIGQGTGVAGLLPAIDGAARYDPIDGRVFLLHAFDAIQNRPQSSPIELLEAARRYDPRLSEVRILLLEAYGKSGRPAEALTEADTLTALLPSDRALIVELVVQLVLLSEDPERMAEALAENGLRGRIMVRLAQRREELALLETLAKPMRGKARDDAERQWVGAFVREIANQGQVEGAKRVWAGLHGVDENSVGKQVLDPEFAAQSGTPPFGWDIGRTAVGLSEIRDGALEIFYYGRREGALASQMLMLDPGNYALRIDQRQTGADAPSGLSWQVGCAPRGARLAQATVARMSASPDAPIGFVVPPDGCRAQYVRLIGAPSDVARRQSLSIESVRIERSGG